MFKKEHIRLLPDVKDPQNLFLNSFTEQEYKLYTESRDIGKHNKYASTGTESILLEPNREKALKRALLEQEDLRRAEIEQAQYDMGHADE